MSKKYVVGLLVLFAVIATSATFAFWASGFTGNETTADGTITIGTGEAVNSTVNVTDVTDGTGLIPKSFDDEANNDVNLTFNVTWVSEDQDAVSGVVGTLTIRIIEIYIEDDGVKTLDNAVRIFELFTITVTLQDESEVEINVEGASGEVEFGPITENESTAITINVEFTDQPEDQAEYNLIAGNDLIITFEFQVEYVNE